MKHDRPTLLDNILYCALLAALVVVIIATGARGETVLVEATVGQGGLICDTAEEVSLFITAEEKGSPQQAFAQVPGCGVVAKPVTMRITWIDEVETEKARYVVVRYDFLDDPSPPQFGVVRRILRGTGS